MSVEENKELIRRFVREVLNTGNLSAADGLLAPEFAVHISGMPPIEGLAAWKQAFGGFCTAFPDMTHVTEDLIAENDRVVMRGATTGTHKGDLMGIPATGKSVRWQDLFIYRIAGGKIVEEWGEMDMLGLLQQLGVAPARE